MLPEKSLSDLVRRGAIKKPAVGGRECATLLKLLQGTDAVRAGLRATLAGQGLTEFGFEVLSAMHALGGEAIPPSVIADHCGIFRGTLTDVLARLEASGLIVRRRNQTDRRQLLAGLTDRGRKVCAHATDCYVNTILSLMSGISTTTLSAIDQTLDDIQAAAAATHHDNLSSS